MQTSAATTKGSSHMSTWVHLRQQTGIHFNCYTLVCDEVTHYVAGSGADERDVVNAACPTGLRLRRVRNATKCIKEALK
jgi:hypothetical protein